MLMRDGRQRSSKIHLLLHKDATPEDAIVAMLHAALFRCASNHSQKVNGGEVGTTWKGMRCMKALHLGIWMECRGLHVVYVATVWKERINLLMCVSAA
jgi:hypothetical protein